MNAGRHKDPFLARHNFLGALRFLVLPLGIFVLANIIFGLIGFHIPQLVAGLKSLLATGQVSPFVEARARLVWGTTLLLFYSAMIAVTLFCVGILRHSLAGKEKRVFLAVASMLGAAVLSHLAYSGHLQNNFSYIFFFTFDSLVASGRYTESELATIKGLVTGVNVLAGLVPILSLLTGCCILSGHPRASKPHITALVGQMRTLKIFIAIGSTLLVTGALHMLAWLRWPAALTAKTHLARQVMEFSEGMSLYWGASFSLLIATFYIPAAWSISTRAEEILVEDPEQARGIEPQEFMEKNGLSLAPLQQMPQLIAIMAPLLVGPIGGTLSTLSGALLGG